MNTLKVQGRILILDPEPSILIILKSILRDTAKDIDVTSDSAEALAKLRSEPYDAFLSEMYMPSMSGIDLIQTLSMEEWSVPTILIARYVDKLGMIRASRFGVMDFIEKPFDEVLVRRAVRNAIRIGLDKKKRSVI